MASQQPLKKNVIAKIVFALYKDGELFSGDSANLDAEYSLDGGSFSNCNDSTPTEIDSSGLYYIDLLAGETDGDVVVLQIKSSTADVVTTPLVFYTAGQTLDEMDTVIDAIAVDVAGIDGDAMRGTDGANTTVPDAAGVVPTAVENRQEMDSNSTRLDADMTSRAPANEYDTELDAVISSRAPANEYDTELDATISSRAPASEYDTEMARITADVATETKQDIMQTSIDWIEAISKNKLVLDVANNKWLLYNAAGTVVILTWDAGDKDDNSITVAVGVPTNRGVPY